jgi:OmpA-OmpF porin, OOP family
MAVNLVEMARNLVTSEVVRSIASHLGESPESIEKAVEGGIPAMLAGLLQTVSSTEGASRLGDLLQHEPTELAGSGGLEGVLHNLGSLLGGASAERLVEYGSVVLNAVFGNKLSQVIAVIQKSSALNASSATSILAMLAPVVMGLLKKVTHTEDFSAPGLVELLLSQKDLIARLAPPGLASALGIQNLADLGATAHAPGSAAAGPSNGAWLPWAAAAAVLLVCAIGYFLWFGAQKQPAQEVGAAANPAIIAQNLPKAAAKAAGLNTGTPANKDAANSLTDDAKPLVETAGKNVTLSLPGDAKLEVPENSYLQQIATFLAKPAGTDTKAFSADNLAFKGSTTDLTAESTSAIDKLATLLKAYSAAKLTIKAHTETAGGDVKDKKVAEDQAAKIKDVLVNAGLPADRIVAIGVPDSPSAGNGDLEGRAKGRRIEFVLATQ